MTKALVFGVTGQDGSYLAEILLEKGYEVHGTYRRSSSNNLWRIRDIKDAITLHRADLCDPVSIYDVIGTVVPDEVYNEADQDNVGWSHDTPGYSIQVTTNAVVTIMEALVALYDRNSIVSPPVKFFQPLTATMLGGGPPQTEDSPLDPKTPYAIAKTATYHFVRYYRERYGLHVSTAIFFNHDSPRRSEDYLLHKICKSALRIAKGEQDYINLGDLNAVVDIGYAPEYMEVAHKILQQLKPDDYVIGTGVGYSVETLAHMALKAVLRKREFACYELVKSDPSWVGSSGPSLVARPAKAERQLGWRARLHGRRLIEKMLEEMRQQ